jgi:hypothetical protein
MTFNYPVGALFLYGKVGYYKYLGYHPNSMNPYSFMVVICPYYNNIYVNECSKQWTEHAVNNGYLIPLSNKLDQKIIYDIENRKKSLSNLNTISNQFNLPDDMKLLISKNMGYLYRIDNKSHIIQNVY